MNLHKTGQLIADARKQKKLTQVQLANLLFLSSAAVSKWERGLSFPDINILEDLANFLDLNVIEIIKGERFEERLTITKEDIDKEIHEIIETISPYKQKIPVWIQKFFSPSSYFIVFSRTLFLIGTIFIILGFLFFREEIYSNDSNLLKFGVAYMVISIALKGFDFIKIKQRQRLLNYGIEVNCSVTRIKHYTFTSMPFQNSPHPYQIFFKYIIDDKIYIGKGELIWDIPIIKGLDLKVYVDPKSPKRYVMKTNKC